MINYQLDPAAKGLTNWAGALGYRLLEASNHIIFGLKWVVLTQEFGLFGSIF